MDYTADTGRYRICRQIKHMFTQNVISFDTGMCFTLFYEV